MQNNDVKELQDIFHYFYATLMQDPYLSGFFSSFEQFPKLIDKQIEYLYKQFNDPNEAIKNGMKIGEIHFKFRIQEDFMFEMLEFIKEKIKNLSFNHVVSIPLEKIEKIFSDFKSGNAISYINGIINESITILEMLKEHHEIIGEQLAFLKDLKEAINNKDYNSSKIRAPHLNSITGKWLSTPAFIIMSYLSKKIIPIIQFFHSNVHKFSSLMLEYMENENNVKALRMGRILSINIYLLVLYLLCLFYEWDKNKENIFFSFLSDPKFNNNIITLMVAPLEKNLQRDIIFSKFAQRLIDYINTSYGDKLFGFTLKNKIYFITYSYSSIDDVAEVIKNAINVTKGNLVKTEEIKNVLKCKLAFIDVDMIKRYYALNSFHLSIMFELIAKTIVSKKEDIIVFLKNDIDEIYKKLEEIIRYECITDNLLLKIKNEYCKKYISGEEKIDIFGQRIVSIKDSSTFGVECLVRILDGNVVIPAYKFISFIKEKGLTKQLDLHVISLIYRYIDNAQELKRIFINLFPTSYVDSEIIESVKTLTQKAEEKDISLVFEITEYEAIESSSILDVLKNLKVDIALDDFGSGYTNLERVAELSYVDNVKFLKIDGEIVRHLSQSEHHRHIIETATFLAQKIGKDIIFEYVEHKEDFELLKEIIKEVKFTNNAYIQGFLFSKPDNIRKFL